MKLVPPRGQEISNGHGHDPALTVLCEVVCLCSCGRAAVDGKCGDSMDFRKINAFSDWDDWAEDGPEWWLRHPLHRPRPGGRDTRKKCPQTGSKHTLR